MISDKQLSPRQEIGMAAQAIAKAFLCKQGLRYLTQNFTCPQGEIDLIMADKETIVFIEVRYRKRADFGSALDSITRRKQLKIMKTACVYMMKEACYHTKAMRFDVISLEGSLDQAQPVWIKQAFTQS